MSRCARAAACCHPLLPRLCCHAFAATPLLPPTLLLPICCHQLEYLADYDCLRDLWIYQRDYPSTDKPFKGNFARNLIMNYDHYVDGYCVERTMPGGEEEPWRLMHAPGDRWMNGFLKYNAEPVHWGDDVLSNPKYGILNGTKALTTSPPPLQPPPPEPPPPEPPPPPPEPPTLVRRLKERQQAVQQQVEEEEQQQQQAEQQQQQQRQRQQRRQLGQERAEEQQQQRQQWEKQLGRPPWGDGPRPESYDPMDFKPDFDDMPEEPWRHPV